MPSTSNQVLQRDQVYGRLISLSHRTNNIVNYLRAGSVDFPADDSVVIYFPAMPDSIPLIRSADYQVTTAYMVPDGVHTYRSTQPLEIPFSFCLHARDEYCTEGALSILTLAGRLQALLLPINTSQNRFTGINASTVGQASTIPAGPTNGAKPAGDQSTGNDDAMAINSGRSIDDPASITGGVTETYFPVTCLLDLISTGEDSPGIRCVGYVKAVNVVLKGPWMHRGTDAYNLPTSADFDFIFVHHPTHTNNFKQTQLTRVVELGPQPGAFANDVKNRLFNTVNITQKVLEADGSRLSFRGFGP